MRWNRHSVLTTIGLLLFCVVVFLPPIIHGYVYPNLGDDTAVHLEALDLMQVGDMSGLGYLGIALVGFPILWINSLTHISIDSLFLWFNYVALALAGITLYLVMSRLVNRQTGWLALVLTIFCAQGVLFQFYFGQIFNVINFAIILPWLVYFAVRYLVDKRVYHLVLVIVFCGLFGSFHSCGIYLPFMAGLAVGVYVVYCLVSRRKIQLRGVALGGGIFLFSIIAAVFVDPFSLMGRDGLTSFIVSLNKVSTRMAVPLASYVLSIVSPSLLAMLVFACLYFKGILTNVRGEIKVLSALLLSGMLVLVVATFIKISFDPWRTALDLATILAMLAAVSVGLFFAGWRKDKRIAVVLVVLIGFGLFHNLPTWFGYNSAIKPVDREAIAYVNTLNRETYNCSPEVAAWIYDRFLVTAKYSGVEDGRGYAPILIVRDSPMTPRSDPDNMWYDNHGFDIGYYGFEDDYNLLEAFGDDEVVVKVYENVGNGIVVPMGVGQ